MSIVKHTEAFDDEEFLINLKETTQVNFFNTDGLG